jgi:hypothetical protein
MTTTTRIRSLTASAIAVAAALTLAACSTGTAATSAPSAPPVAVAPPVSVAPIDTPSPDPTASEAASPEASTTEATAVPTSIDPCKIVTVEEVNKLTGANFKAGKEETDTNNVKRCTYGEQGVSFMVTAAVAPDVATAQKNEADTRADLEANAPGFPYKLTELPGFAPGADAAIVEGSADFNGTTLSGVAIYVLRNTTFFALTDISTLGAKAPTAAQMEAQAKVTLDRVP